MLTRLAPTLALALVLGSLGWVAGCEKNKPVPTDEPDASGGPEVIVEEPGTPPVEPEPKPEPDEPAPDNEPPGGTEIVKTKVPCQSDADCVKDSCCHATSCVAAANAPNCSGAMCTMDCRANTMDCYGGCLCQDGVCAAEIWLGTAPP